MAQVLVVVHGMGVNDDGWAASIASKLNEVARRYEVFRGSIDAFVLAQDASDPLLTKTGPNQIVIVPAGYDHVFQQQAIKTQKNAKAVIDAAHGGLPAALNVVLGALDGAGETEKNFFWSHVVDVLLYRYFAAITTPVRLAVMETVARVLATRNTQVSLMAHSLGTAVSHDALSLLSRGKETKFAALQPPGTRLANYFAIANVSRVLEKALPGDMDVYLSPVSPISVRGANAYTMRFFNFRHALDPFPIPKRFEPDWLTGDDYEIVDNLLHLGDFNVHGWENYLDSPEVHIPVLNALAATSGWEGITEAVARASLANFRAAPVPLCEHGLAWWTEQTRRLRKRVTENPTVPELLATGALFFAVAEGARAVCRGGTTVAALGALTARVG